MIGWPDWLCFIAGGLAIVFLSWVLGKFTEQLAGSGKSATRAHAETERHYVVEAAPRQKSRGSAQNY